MKIAFFHEDVYPPKEGSSVQSFQIYSQLIKQHTVLTPHTCPFPSANHAYSSIRDMRKLITKVDVIFIIVDGVPNFFYEKFSVMPALLGINIPVIWMLNAPIEEALLFPWYPKYRYSIDRLLRKIFSTFVNECICVSDPLVRYAKSQLYAKSFSVISNGATKQARRKKIHRRNSVFHVLWVGSGSNPWHAMDAMVEVACRMASTDSTIDFTFVTDDSWYPIPTLPNIHVMKGKSHTEIAEYYRNADVALCIYHPTSSLGVYNSPLKLFDAFSFGVPVVASRTGDLTRIVENGGHAAGVLVSDTPEDIMRGIQYIRLHQEAAKRMADAGRKLIASQYNWERVGKQIDDVLHKAVGGKG